MNAVPQFRATPTTQIVFSFLWNKDIQISLSIFLYLSLLPKVGQTDSEMVGFGIILKMMSEGHDQSTFIERENAIILKHLFSLQSQQFGLVCLLCLPFATPSRRNVGCIRKAYIFKNNFFPV